jgi:hypothetical protein
MERAIVNLTIKCVTELRSQKLIKIVIELMDKLRDAMKSKVERLIEIFGRPHAKKISEMALSWGNTSAIEWASNPGFLRYTVLTYMNASTIIQI